MADFTGSDLTLAAHQALTHPGLVVGTPVNVDAFLAAKWYLWHANIETTANATGVSYFLQASRLTSGDNDWATISEIITGVTAAVLANIAGSEAAGQKTIAVGAGEEASFAAKELIYLRDTTTENLSEWGRVDSLPTNIIDIWDGLTNAKDSADDILSQAEEFLLHVDLAGIFRIRLVTFHRAATGADIAFKSFLRNATAIE